MNNFSCKPVFNLPKDKTRYKLLDGNFVTEKKIGNESFLFIEPEALTMLAEKAVRDVSHLQRESHLASLRGILDAPDASENDKYVANQLIENAVIASKMEYPICQDTGTIIVVAKKGENIHTKADDVESLSHGIWSSFQKYNFRYSQIAPVSMYKEENTKDNLPAQIDIESVLGNEYEFLFIAKGGGSSNKTSLFQETKALLNRENLLNFLREKISNIGTSACPPYHLAIVIGGTSPEMNLKTVKLASAKYYDDLPAAGNKKGYAFRDKDLEKEVFSITKELGIGAQFGGRYFCHDVRVIRLPRHGASCPVGIGISCSADRNIKAKINKNGIFLEELETKPEKYLEKEVKQIEEKIINIDLSKGMSLLKRELSKYPVGTRIMLNGEIIVARDMAHAIFIERLKNGQELPAYLRNSIVFYAGPAKTPCGRVCGSLGPTTASRMDPYLPLLQENGASIVTLAKGSRSASVVKSCKENGGFYLGTIGGAAALLGHNCVRSIKLLEFPELGMEAVYRIDVTNFPAFLIIDNKGNNFYNT